MNALFEWLCAMAMAEILEDIALAEECEDEERLNELYREWAIVQLDLMK